MIQDIQYLYVISRLQHFMSYYTKYTERTILFQKSKTTTVLVLSYITTNFLLSPKT